LGNKRVPPRGAGGAGPQDYVQEADRDTPVFPEPANFKGESVLCRKKINARCEREKWGGDNRGILAWGRESDSRPGGQMGHFTLT